MLYISFCLFLEGVYKKEHTFLNEIYTAFALVNNVYYMHEEVMGQWETDHNVTPYYEIQRHIQINSMTSWGLL